MGMMSRNTLLSTFIRSRKMTLSNELLDAATSRPLFRPAKLGRHFPPINYVSKNGSGQANWVKYETPRNDVKNFRVLLIGNEQNSKNLRMRLSSHPSLNFEYIEARSGKHSLRVIDREPVDLIVFGDVVADMDGLTFLGSLNRQCGNQKIPVIEILNSESLKDGVQAMKMGVHNYLLKDADGQYFELLPILVSRIYAEKQMLNALRETAGVNQVISDSTPSVIYQLSLQGGPHDIRFSSQILELGFSAEHWGNDSELHHQLCYEADRPAVKKALESCYKTGADFQCEYRINTVGNTLKWFHDKAKILMDKYGRPQFLHGVMTDISAYKSLESEISHYRRRIDEMVQQRTERLDRRVSILESCNSSLSDNYHQMHMMYVDLLIKTQAQEQECEGDKRKFA